MSEEVSSSDRFIVGPPDVWVSADNENAAEPYLTMETAAPDIASAVAVSADGTTIHVLDGTYRITTPVSLAFGIRLVGESGTSDSVIVTNTVAAMSGSSNHGILQLNHPNAFAANLTLAGGHIYHDSSYAGGVTIGASGGTVSNCVITAAKAGSTYGRFAGALVEGGLLTHCFFENGSVGGTEHNTYSTGACVSGSGRVENCLFHNIMDAGQQTSIVLMDGNGSLVNCTIVDCVVKDKVEGSGDSHAIRTLSSTATVRNVLVANVTEVFSGEKRDFGGTATNENAFAACASDLAEPVNEACYVGTLAQLFQNYANGDLRAGSLCANKGINPAAIPATDLAGNSRLVGDRIDIGCYEAPSGCTVILLQ